MERKSSKETLEKIKKGTIWFLKSCIWVMPVLFALDLITKYLAEVYLTGHDVVVIPHFFTLSLLYNTGAAWGSFGSYTAVLATISGLASVGLIIFLSLKWKSLNGWYRASLFLIISGALGNFIDRIRCAWFGTKGVIDFLQFTFGSYVFPTFNLADSYLTVGAIVLILYVIFSDLIFAKKKEQKEQNANVDEEVIRKNDEISNKEEPKAKIENDDEKKDDSSSKKE